MSAEWKEKLYVPLEFITEGDGWRLFPCIEVSYTKDIPCDYPGPMGVPITAMDKIGTSGEKFEILDTITPQIGDRRLYQRIIIRNLHPELPKIIDLNAALEKYGSKYRGEFAAFIQIPEKETKLK